MAPHLILFVAGLTSAWAVLTIIGGERERVVRQAELLRRVAAETDANDGGKGTEQTAAKKPPSSVPSVTKPAR